MAKLTVDQLSVIMRNCVGADEAVDLDGDINDTPFDELGYDSLAVLEVITQVQTTYLVKIPDEAVDELRTPAALIEYVNRQTTQVGQS